MGFVNDSRSDGMDKVVGCDEVTIERLGTFVTGKIERLRRLRNWGHL